MKLEFSLLRRVLQAGFGVSERGCRGWFRLCEIHKSEPIVMNQPSLLRQRNVTTVLLTKVPEKQGGRGLFFPHSLQFSSIAPDWQSLRHNWQTQF